MVCTHGSVDAACATLGFPVYRELRALAEAPHSGMRVWRVSHFGGHVFAPTLIDMPEFRYWGYAEREVAAQIAARAGHGLQLRDHYRGWAALDSPFLQAAERELFGLHGWAWSALHKSGHVLRGGPAWADVRIEYATPAGRQRGAYAARVELCGYVECIASTYDEQPFRFPQYDVVALDHRAL
jgi:hypothetical protein